MIDLKAKFPDIYEKMNIATGGFHVLMNGLRHLTRLMSPTFVQEIKFYRTSEKSQVYLQEGAQIRQLEMEGPQHDAAFVLMSIKAMRQCEGYADAKATDVARYMHARAKACPAYAIRLAGWSGRSALNAMSNASRDTERKPDYEQSVN